MRRSSVRASLSDADRPAADESSARQRGLRAQRIVTAAAAGLWLLAAAQVAAQNSNFATPGSSNRSLGLPDQDGLQQRVDDAPWRAGIFRFSPWFGVRDASLVTGTRVGDGTDDTNDFTATVGAGLRTYIRTGDKLLIAGHVLPEYTWWVDDANRRRLNGRYGLGVFAFLNRLDLELSHRLTEQQTFFSSEVQRLTPIREQITRALLTLQLGSRLELTLRGIRTESSSEENDGPLAGFLGQLDRSEDNLQALVGYRAPRGWRFALGYDATRVDFASDARPLSNDSRGLRLEAGFTGNRFDGLLELSAIDIEPDNISGVRSATETIGVAEAIWGLSERSALLTYARRTLSYSVTGGASYFIGDRYGARWQSSWTRFGVGLWAEAGNDTFAALVDSPLARVDDVVSLGAEANLALRSLRLRFSLSRSDYSSPDTAFDRDVTTIGVSIELEPLEKLLRSATDRLRFGATGGIW